MNFMHDPYTQFSPPRSLRKVKRLPLLPRGLPDHSGVDEPLNPQKNDIQSITDDEQKRQKAIDDLISVWQQRLQLMTLVSTFFSSVNSGLLGLVVKTETTPLSPLAQIANATFLGGLIIHVFSALIAFLASFLLIDYRIHETETEIPKDVPSNKEKSEKHHGHHGHHGHRGHHVRSASLTQDIPPRSANPHVVYVGPFSKQKPPLQLLGKCNSLCLTLSSTGLLLTFIGACSYAWTAFDRSVSIFASICIVLCILLCVTVIGMYDTQGIVIKVNVSIT